MSQNSVIVFKLEMLHFQTTQAQLGFIASTIHAGYIAVHG
jgi:hypothetical protein